MSIVQLAAARCQPTSPNSIITWSPEEEIKASTALRRELCLARSAQCRTLFVEREKRLSAERLARLALEEALVRHKTCTGERDAARTRAADAATLAARRRLSAGSAHRDADVESGDKRAAFQVDRLRARRRRDDGSRVWRHEEAIGPSGSRLNSARRHPIQTGLIRQMKVQTSRAMATVPRAVRQSPLFAPGDSRRRLPVTSNP